MAEGSESDARAPRITTATLASVLGARLRGDPEVVLSGATHDSRQVTSGALFCCVPGERVDGHTFARAALDAGAAALLVQRPLELDVPQLEVADVRAAMAPAAAAIWGDPSAALVVVGVTGTNGKTTVVSMLAHVLAEAGHRVEVIGTLTGARTTPEATELQATLATMRDDGVTHVAMEVSSHALALHRVDSVVFDVSVFTNLGSDHLDFHHNLEDYFAAKAALFEPSRSSLAVLNLDDVRGRLLRDASEIPVIGFSVEELADLGLGPRGASFTWRGVQVELPLPGRHNVANALATAETALALGVDAASVAAALATTPPIPGRFEVIPPSGEQRSGTQPATSDALAPIVVVDFAHTPAALERTLEAARELAGSGSLTVVFGCGGDRDPSKRPAMGRIASEGADRVVITTDNPRSEDPLRIIAEIRTGCVDEPIIEPDRRAAIVLALEVSGPGDVVVIAGKGHETGQVFADRTEAFDDSAVAAELLVDPSHGTGRDR